MLVDWKQLLQDAMKALGSLGKGNPKIMEAAKSLGEAGAAHGALDDKTRELISLAVAVTTRCETCIAVHAKAAVAAGASREQLLEAMAVAVNLNTGAAMVYASHALDAYDTLSK